ncbi:hypothetical protein [Myxococcus sp. CA039A]|uniref:hypothetical protein n=1 Tax=Myxococcus sp. CA039A TaxID=2741737 RepID=UPI00157B9621|nr:hypothetical protein [Myxococcus sp. CA039A]NTX50616.1 hypothetical protein [Myxococcus sp. CA039A]
MKWLLGTVWLGSACVAGMIGCSRAPAGASEPGEELSTREIHTLATSTVRVTKTTRFHTAAGITEQAEELSTDPPELLVPQGETYSGREGAAVPGGWEFQDVPAGQYFLRFHDGRGARVQFLTDARHVELGPNRLGRPDARYFVEDWAPAQVDLQGLAPWVAPEGLVHLGAHLQFNSPQVGAAGWLLFDEFLRADETSVVTDDVEALIVTADGVPHLEAARGDRLYVNQLSPFRVGTAPDGTPLEYAALDRSRELPPFDHVPNYGTPLSISGTLQPVLMRQFGLDWRLSEFARMARDIHPGMTPRQSILEIHPAAHGLAPDGWVGYSGELLSLYAPLGATYDIQGPVKFGIPYPSSWGIVGAVTNIFHARLPIPDGSSDLAFITGSLTTLASFDEFRAGPVRPKLSPPQSLTLDGAPANESRHLSTLSPVVAWAPPALGTPNVYQLLIRRYIKRSRSWETLGSIYVPGTTTAVRLPPGSLEPEGIYFMRIRAVDAPMFDVGRHSVETLEALPNHSADAITSLFTTP